MSASPARPLTVMIVEDEAPARALLSKWLSCFDELTIVAQAERLNSARTQLKALKPDIVFLDIELPDGASFDLLDEMSLDNRPYIIFTTAYDAYAAQAFRLDAVDYLVKPFDREHLEEAVSRTVRRFRSDNPMPHGPQDELRNIVRVKHRGQTVLLLASEISYLSSEDYYTAIHVSGRQYLSRTPLKTFEQTLARHGFVQVHRSSIVNIAWVTTKTALPGGDAELKMRSGDLVRLSRRYREEFDARLQAYLAGVR
ncbi:MAG: response regulator transcription factor [Parvularculaceae bacterium]|nr:response regulator transcription factor [Parvularculaceae bacterium]